MTENKAVFLRGKKTILRPIRESDVEPLQVWVNDERIRNYISRYLPVSETQEKNWIADLGKRPNDIILGIEALYGKLIGTIGLHKINAKDCHATHGVIIGSPDHWSGGYGTDAGTQLFNWAFDELNLRKIKSSVISYNRRSLNYHLKCGFEIVGKWRQDIYKHGQYHDIILLDLLKEDWPPIWAAYNKK